MAPSSVRFPSSSVLLFATLCSQYVVWSFTNLPVAVTTRTAAGFAWSAHPTYVHRSSAARGVKRSLPLYHSYAFNNNNNNHDDQSSSSPNRNNKEDNEDYTDDYMMRSGTDELDRGADKSQSRLEELKQREMELRELLDSVRKEKLSTLMSRPLTIGVIGFGRFGQFISRTFAKYGRVVVTSRSDHTETADGMGVKYVPLSRPDLFLAEGLDVIVVAVSITSFKDTVAKLAPFIRNDIQRRKREQLEQQLKMQHRHQHAMNSFPRASEPTSQPIIHGPLVVDVLSVKEHARNILIDLLPPECDILCTHPMFGPDSGKDGWKGLNFVYEKTRIDSVLWEEYHSDDVDNANGSSRNSDEDDCMYARCPERVDRVERFLSIWEEEGCNMVPMSCRAHDAHAANSQFITHLVGRVLGSQGLAPTPIDTSGFQSVLKLIDSTTADSFELFYGLYKYNSNSVQTIRQLQYAMEDVVAKLQQKEEEDERGERQQSDLREIVAELKTFDSGKRRRLNDSIMTIKPTTVAASAAASSASTTPIFASNPLHQQNATMANGKSATAI